MLPPHRIPTSVTLLPVPCRRKTGEPLSPGPAPAETQVWQSWVMLVPSTLVLTQVPLTDPRVHPVVRPILCTCCPATALPSAVIVKLPVIVSEPLFAPLVRAIRPSVEVMPLA